MAMYKFEGSDLPVFGNNLDSNPHLERVSQPGMVMGSTHELVSDEEAFDQPGDVVPHTRMGSLAVVEYTSDQSE